MRKIYPPPFNKFVAFVFYGLLSIAVIVSAQGPLMTNDCVVEPLGDTAANRQVIGYVHPEIDPKTIRWEFYDYINIIVSDFDPGKVLKQITALNDAKGKTKILLSIRNYDLSKWDNNNNSKFYQDVVNNISNFIIANNLDGVDIEYPGMRGSVCNPLENANANASDETFSNFVKDMKSRLQFFQPATNTATNKRIMLTVGLNTVDAIIALNSVIDFLNIETYHYSLYANLPPLLGGYSETFPNSPSPIFIKAYNNWSGNGISKEKIIMGVDFGNTIQVVSNSSITENQSVYFLNAINDIKSTLPPDVATQLTPIKGLCPSQNSQANTASIYSWPWKGLSSFALNSTTNYCTENTKNNWKRKFDSTNNNPWLFKQYNPSTPFFYYFVSYEDISSLRIKLTSIPPVGISVSDVSYDDDNNSLLNYIRGNPLPIVELPKNPNSDKQKTNTGVIVGAVLGGLLLLVISCFIWYRQRSLLKSKNSGTIPKSSMRSHTTSTKNVEMSSDSSPNRFAAPTTVIPVASGYVTAMFDFEGKEENDLSFKKGDKIEVLERGDGPNDWWVGRVNGTVGEFPGNYVKETG